MSEKKLSNTILDELKEQQAKPKPKWHFLLHEWLLWFIGAVSVLIGGLAMSIIFVQVRLIDWDLLQVLGRGGLFQIMPYLWFVLLILFVLIAQYQIKHTKRGYEYSLAAVVFLLISLSLLIGSVFYQYKIGYLVHSHLSGASPIYRTIADQRSKLWSQPQQGRLSGVLLDVINQDEIVLIDEQGKVWTVFLEEQGLPQAPFSRGIPQEFKLRINGEMISDNEFKAIKISPWVPPRDAFREQLQRPSATNRDSLRIR